MKILLVEDDEKLGKNTQTLLTYENCSVEWVQTGNEALNRIKFMQDSCFDVILLDWMLPEMDGLSLCKLFRNKYGFQGGIVFVTAKSDVDDCVNALNAGADDFIVKPYKVKELIARIHAVARRKAKPYIDRTYAKEGFSINKDLHIITFNEQSIHLRKKEFAILELLFVNLRTILPRNAIFETVWSDKSETNEESLDSHIYNLRKKLKIFPNIQITSFKNIGYKMEIIND